MVLSDKSIKEQLEQGRVVVSPLEIEAREAAAADLIAKANQIAELTGVALGKPVFIAEVGRSAPKTLAMASRAFDSGLAAAVETPILTGELDVVITLQARYAIQ